MRKNKIARTKYTAHIVSHTHWDREWYKTFEQFRLRLVALVDDLLVILKNKPAFRHFMLDGQTIILEDYLQVRPERKAELAGFIRRGRIAVGPWYVLPDQFLVSGEALIRNLLAGLKIAREFGGAMQVGYLPDQFGQIAQMPQILRKVGITRAVVWRGIIDRKLPSEFIWQAPDNTRVLAHFLSIDLGYLNALRIPRDAGAAYARLLGACKERKARALTPHVLLLNGVDHAPADGHLADLLPELNRRGGDIRFVHDSLAHYFRCVEKAAPRLPVRTGEFRATAKDGAISWLVPGVLSARMPAKIMNHAVQTLLEKWAEPLATMAWLKGAAYPAAFLEQAWRHLLQNHPHDSIAGSSLDDVCKDMEARFRWASEIGRELLAAAFKTLCGCRAAVAPQKQQRQALTLFNPLVWERSETVFCDVQMPVDAEVKGFALSDAAGEKVPFQVVETKKILAVPEFNQQKYTALRVRLAFLARKIPPCGMKTYWLEYQPEFCRAAGSLVTGKRQMENEYLAVKIARNGTLTLRAKPGGHVYRNLNYFEDCGDAGDLYNYSPPRRDRVFSTRNLRPRIRVLHDGPVFAEMAVEYRFRLPQALTGDRAARSARRAVNKIVARVRLARNSRRVDIFTEVENRSQDHRLRVCFPSGVRAHVSRAEGQFAIVTRPIALPDTSAWIEQDGGTRPQLSFVDLSDRRRGLTVINRGLPEFEAGADKARTVAITLLRCVGYIQRNDLTTRREPPDSVPLAVETPAAQCPGRWSFEYSLYPHQGDYRAAVVHCEAYNHNVPVKTFQAPAPAVKGRSEESFFSTDSPQVLLSCLKKADDFADGVILRLVNLYGRRVACKLVSACKVKCARETDFLGRPQGRLALDKQGNVRLVFRPGEIKTIVLQVRRLGPE